VEEAVSLLKPGYSLDRYELLCPLASGGMAAVWLARMRGKRGFEKLFAIKTIRAELVDDPRFEEMFLDEARIASGIQHPNVAHILDLGEKEGVLYLVMEWVDGETLARVRKFASKAGAKLPLGLALRIIADACAGLHAAHELEDESGKVLGVVHRDVSPQNILIATSGAVKLIDFGIAKAENRAAPRTRTGIVKGKLSYMPPEQARGGKVLDRRVDVWALGVCLYELVAEKLPFEGDNQLEILTKVTNAEEPPPILGAPESVREILSHSIAKDPDERFATAAAMRRAIEGVIGKLGLASTNDDIAAFVEAHLPERAEKRRELVAQALKDAAKRSEIVDVYTGTVEVVAPGARELQPNPPRAAELKTSAASPGGKKAAQRPSALALLEGKAESSSATLDSASVAGNAGTRAGGGMKWIAGLVVLGLAGAGIYEWGRSGPVGESGDAAGPASAVPPSSIADASPAVDALSPTPADTAPRAPDDASTASVVLPSEGGGIAADGGSTLAVPPTMTPHEAPPAVPGAPRHKLRWPEIESGTPPPAGNVSPAAPPDGEDNPY
jgi:serine/threonine protein kinase